MSAVAVIGANGELGRLVVSSIAPSFERVIAVDRAPGLHVVPSARTVTLDVLSEPDRLRAVLEGVEAVVHLAFRPQDGDHETLRAVVAASSDAGVDHVTLVRSAMVYGAWPNNPVPISEDAPVRPNPTTAFAVHKADAERALLVWRDAEPELRDRLRQCASGRDLCAQNLQPPAD